MSGTERGLTTVNVAEETQAVARAAIQLVRKKTGRNYTMRQFTEEAFAAQLRVIAETYNEGRAIAPAADPLPPGRPLQDRVG